MDGKAVQQVLVTKFLDIEIDHSLNWKSHITKVEQKISSAVGVLGRIRYKLNQKTALMLYNTLILPHIGYCNLIWASNYKSALVKLYQMQKRALRICTKVYPFNSITN